MADAMVGEPGWVGAGHKRNRPAAPHTSLICHEVVMV